MTGSGIPCGACKFLRRKCVKGCVFAPYFCHEQSSTHFAAIHKVFGASNVAKLLRQLPVNDRSEAATTISYEAQARVHDPVYGCVSHIFALQQQVVSLQAQLAALKQHATNTSSNPRDKYYGKATSSSNYPQDVQSWLQSEYPQMVPPYDPSLNRITPKTTTIYGDQGGLFINNNDHYHDSMVQANEQDVSIDASYEGSSSHHSNNASFENKSKWPFDDSDDLHSMTFGYR
ncbi:LOB domain-containing protein 29-like [Silene latifolia]|uniref:LOB domain-containing protein 29-like n=1 Tax=Silene latifolia TaxID=37657 RepID=UPI003D78AA6C